MAGLLQTSTTFLAARGLREVASTPSVRSSGVAVRCSYDDNAATRTVSRREVAITALMAGVLSPWIVSENRASADVLVDDGDEELIEKLKQGRKARSEKRVVLGEYKSEEAQVQNVVYGLSLVGRAIDEADLAAASAALEASTISDGQAAVTKLSRTPDESAAAAEFDSALAGLKAAVSAGSTTEVKAAFVSSAKALQQWAAVAGLKAELQGL